MCLDPARAGPPKNFSARARPGPSGKAVDPARPGPRAGPGRAGPGQTRPVHTTVSNANQIMMSPTSCRFMKWRQQNEPEVNKASVLVNIS